MIRIFLLVWALVLCFPAYGGVRVVVPSHDIPRGATIAQADLSYTTTENNVMVGTVTSMHDLVGMQARRTLRAGETVRLNDVRKPILVTRGSTVSMTFEAPGIVLTTSGKAMSEGGLGDTVTVQNPASYRMVSAVVTGPGQVTTRAGATRLANVQP